MKAEAKHIEEIRSRFQNMETKENFLDLLNYSKSIVYGEKAIPFKLSQLNFYSNPNKNKRRYKEFSVSKKSGGKRSIHAPVPGLKAIQKSLNLIFQCVYEPHHAAKGFVWSQSIVDNARVHARSNYVLNIDLKDFFPSVDQARVWKRIQLQPFNLGSSTKRISLAGMIGALCCTQLEVERLNEQSEWVKVQKNVLPQGAPTSPTLTNAICEKLDIKLSGLAKRFGVKYSRYADDITFSSSHNIYQKDGDFLKEVYRIVNDQHFHIKESKFRLQRTGYRQEVTGLTVNEKPNVKKRYIKQLRLWLYYWERYGYERAYSYFLQQYVADKGHVKKGKPDMINVIAGKLEYLKMVRGMEDATVMQLISRMNKAMDSGDKNISMMKSPLKKLENIVDLIIERGLDDAMKNYGNEL